VARIQWSSKAGRARSGGFPSTWVTRHDAAGARTGMPHRLRNASGGQVGGGAGHAQLAREIEHGWRVE